MAEKLIKICFVVPRAYYLFNPAAKNIGDKVGGAQKQAFLLSKSLAKNGKFEVHFIVADFGQQNKTIVDNVTIWKSFNFNQNILLRSYYFLKLLIKVKADIYLFRSADFGVALAVLFTRYILWKKTVYMLAHNIEADYKSSKKFFGTLTAIFMQLVYKTTEKLIAQTKEQGELFHKKKKRKPDEIIRNIIEMENETLQFKKEKDIVIWVGRLDKLKQPEIFLDLAKIYKNEKFVMIAPAVFEHYKYGTDMQEQIKNVENIEYIEFVKPNEIKSYYDKAKIYITTSVEEGFSNTMMEAMASECAILSLKVNPENIINDYQLGYCADNEVNNFYKLFEKLSNNPSMRKIMGQKAADYLRKNHNAVIEAKKLAALLIDLDNRK